ncbi:hypothetical protein E6Q11_02355 [Candidatus Dojkabacteria bacterium]|uniref:Uncharacterized protein n=1 Tax=Candidatus Dojkabacteria bacterium TaxID=2099670 RepID=A0A5C7J7S2_9BACT|nr:MAG: hypothetical protein E6Q11_02355 [Candidatus Dojkabacteria bacterium]
MGKIFKPEIQAPAPPPPPPSPVGADPAEAAKTQKAMEDAASAERKARGRAATLLTGGEGVEDPATISKRMLLGS